MIARRRSRSSLWARLIGDDGKKYPMNAIIAQRIDGRETRRAIRREIARCHEAESKRSGFWRRIVVWWKIERAVRAELTRRFPPQALYSAR